MDSHSTAEVDIDSLSHHAGADTVTIPDAHLLFGGDYQRSGADLIVSDHDHRVVVSNYFQGDKRPTLVSPDGAPLDPKVIEALTGHVQYAQASGAAAAAKVVGHVIKMTGSASVVRNGVTITLNQGENVLQNDVVQTGSGSTLGLVMIDGTTFNLTAGARLMLNDLTYDANSTSNTSLFTLVQGAANFVAGQVAKTGDMKVGTPVATMGIRGTAVILDISAVDGKVSISVVDQRDGQIHAVQVFNSRGILIGTVTSSGSGLTLTPIANFEVIAQASDKTVAQVAQEFNAFQALLQTYDAGKVLFPTLPQHTDANPQSPTRYAGSTPATSNGTEYHAPADSGTVAPTGGTPTTVVITSSAPTTGGPPGIPGTTPSDPVVVQKTVSVIPIPFVVTPASVSPITSGPGDHSGPVMSASGDVVYDPDGIIYFYDRETGVTTRVTPAGDGLTYGGQTISSDGRFVVYQGSDGTHSYVFVWGTDPADPAHYHQQTQLASGTSPAISGDGSTILVEQGGNIAIYDLQGNAKGMITPAAIGTTGTLWKPAISADGHVIAFWNSDSSGAGGSGHLYTYDLSTGAVTEIASTAAGAGTTAASMSADGHFVVYQGTAPGGHSEIYLYDLTTGHVVFSTVDAPETLTGASRSPVISPDGHFIIFTSDAQLTGDDGNAFADTYIVDVTHPEAPVYKLVSAQGDAASDGGVAISAGGQYVAFASNATFSSGSGAGSNIFVADSSSGRSAIIQETANSPASLTATGIIGITGGVSGVTLTVTDQFGNPTSVFGAGFDANGNIKWNFAEAKADFASLPYGQDASQQFIITLSSNGGSTTIPVTVTVHNAVQPAVTPADVAPVAAPVALAEGTEDIAFTITSAALLAGVGDIDTPLSSLHITDVTIKSGGGSLTANENGTWTYTPAADFNGAVAFNYTVSDGTKIASSTASLHVAAVNDVATIDGNASGSVVEDSSTTTSGALTVHDVDNGENHFQAVPGAALVGTYGNFTFNQNTGTWTYALDHARADSLTAGQSMHDTLTVTSADGTASQVIDVTVAGSNDAATISGQATGSVVEDGSTTTNGSLTMLDVDHADAAFQTVSAASSTTSGVLTVHDVDSGENHFQAVPAPALVGSYGNFTFNENTGTWTYALDHTRADSLTAGQLVHDKLTVTSADGTASQVIDVTITGSNDAPVAVADTGVSITQNGGVDVSFSPILNAHATGEGSEYVITQAANDQAGALWSNSKVSLNTSFTISADLFFGANDDGADGFSFIIQNQSKTIIGASGGGLGYQGIAHSVAIEFDTYNNDVEYNDIPHDHAAFDTNGSMSGLGAPIDLGNIEDGQYHPVTIDWNAATHVITLSYNGSMIGSQTIDVAAIVDSGEAYIGFAGSTGAADNLQMIRDLTYQSADDSVVLDVLVNDTDVDAGDKATLHVVSAASAGGASVTFNGQPGAGIVYSPAGKYDYLAAGQTATDTVTYTIQDSHGAQSTTTAQVTIHGLNDAPTLTATAANPSFTEASGLGTQAAAVTVFSGADSSAIDDGQAITGLTFNVGGLVDGANEKVIVDGTTIALGSASTGSTSSGLTYTVAIEGGTATVALSSAAGISAAAADTLVNNIAYQDSSADAPTAGDRTFTLTQITDSGGTLNTTALSIASTVHVVAVNDAPDFTGRDLAPGYVAGGEAVALVSGVLANDIDNADYAGGSLTATVTGNFHIGDSLTIADGDTIFVSSGTHVMFDVDGVGYGAGPIEIGALSGGGSSLTVMLNADADNAAVEALAQAIQFENGKSGAVADPRTVTFTLQDGGGTANGGDDSDSFTATVNVTAPADHAPVANDDTLAPTAASENSTLTISASTLLENDTDPDVGDHPTIVSVSATSADGAHVTVSGSTISYDPTHAAELQALAAGATATDTFSYTINDGHGGNDTATVTLVVAGVNDAPVFTGHDLESGYVASGAAVALVDGVSAHDIDSADYAGGSLTATVTGNAHVGDSLTIPDADNIFLTVSSGTHVMFDSDGVNHGAGAIEIGRLSGSGTSLTVTLNASASNAAVEALTEAIRFSSSDPTADDRVVTITLNDGDGIADGGHDFARIDATVHVTAAPPPNLPPSITGDMAVVAVTGGGEVALTIADLNATDFDTDADHRVFTVDQLNHGRLTFGDDRVPLDEGATFTLADVQDGRVYYQSVGTYVGQDHISLSLSDNVAGTPTATAILGATVVDAQFTVLTADGYDFNQDDPVAAMGSATIVEGYSDTAFTLLNLDTNREFIFSGTGFDYSGPGADIRANSGTITSIQEMTHDTQTPLASFGLHVDAGVWIAAAQAAAEGNQSPIETLTSSWTFNFIGNAGADAFSAGNANDIFTGRTGNDSFYGDFGYDRAYYGGNAGPVLIALALGTVYEFSSGPSPVLIGTDTLRSIEMVTGGNAVDYFDATNFGTLGSNVGSKVTANDDGLFNEFEGRGGDDVIVGNGQTRISYYHATSGVTVTFTPNSWTSTSSGGSGTQTGDASVGNDHFSGVNSVRGSNFGDVFFGSTNPSQTAENFEGMGGDDQINGGGGFDRAVYQLTSDGIGIDVQLAAGTVTDRAAGTEVGHDTLRSVEAVWGTDFADRYDATGFSSSSTNAGSAGGITNAFNEFEGGGGADDITGNGNTRLAFYHATGGVTAALGSGGSATVAGNDSVGNDVVHGGVNAVRGSVFNDIITGNGSNNTLEGLGGNDVIDGRGGNDSLTGGTGADIFVYGAGGGADTITDFSRGDADRIDLRAFTNIHSLADVQAHASADASTVISFGAGNSLTINGVTSADLHASDFIFAGQVAITVQSAGYDFSTLYHDLAVSYAGLEAGDFALSNDATHMFLVDADKGMTFELIGTGFTYDGGHLPTSGTIAEINILYATNPADPAQFTQDHVLVNSNGWNLDAASLIGYLGQYAANPHGAGLGGLDGIFGAASYNYVGGSFFNYAPNTGYDGLLQAGGFTSVFLAGDHADVFNGIPASVDVPAAGFAIVDYSHASGPVSVNLQTGFTSGVAAAGDTFASIDGLRGSDFADHLTGDGGPNVLEGGLGDDTVDGGTGYIGNIVSYQHATPGMDNVGVTVDLSLQGASQDTVQAGWDTLTNFRDIVGSAGNDTLIGDGNDNFLIGGAGADALHGGGGTDTADYELASTGVTVSLAHPDLNTGEAAGDSYVSIESVTGSHFNDILIGNSGNNTFWGLDGNDNFVFNAKTSSTGQDTIGDFVQGRDHIELDYLAFTPGNTASFDAWVATHTTQQANGLLIDLNVDGHHANQDTILLSFTPIVLSMNDFILHPGP